MNKLFSTVILVVSLCFGSLSAAEVAGQKALYYGFSLIGHEQGGIAPDMAILISNGRIEQLGPSETVRAKAPAGVDQTNVAGWYALPGLIDTHVHLATQPDPDTAKKWLKRHIYSGVTSVRDMAGDMRLLAELARLSRTGKIPAPGVYYAALMAGPSFFNDPRPASAAEGSVPGKVPWMQAITPETDMEEAVALARGTWATGIKIYANLPGVDVRRIAAEARRQGIKVWAHSMVFPATPDEVVRAGVDVVSHVCRMAWQLVEEKPQQYHHKLGLPYERLDPQNPVLKTLFTRMKQQGTILDATLWLYTHLEARRQKQVSGKPGPAVCPPAFAAALTASAHAAGVDVSTGTDVILPLEEPYPALFHELEALVNGAGFTPQEAINAATRIGARVLGLEHAKGAIEVGRDADILFLEKNPLESIENMRSVVLTIKGGVPYARDEYAPGP